VVGPFVRLPLPVSQCAHVRQGQRRPSQTFGPTYQPMYQVKFNSAHPLDLNEAHVSRPVFHVPARSKYIFVAELAKLRGSDARNVHDEEPAEYELEFLDNEAEASHEAKLWDRFVSLLPFLSRFDALCFTQTTCITQTQRPHVARTYAQPGLGCFLWMEPICRARRVRHGSELWRESVACNPSCRTGGACSGIGGVAELG
jgi:hypothetical protein